MAVLEGEEKGQTQARILCCCATLPAHTSSDVVTVREERRDAVLPFSTIASQGGWENTRRRFPMRLPYHSSKKCSGSCSLKYEFHFR